VVTARIKNLVSLKVLFSLLVTTDGIPIGYKVFAGNIYEGHTLIPVLNKIKQKYEIDKVIFVARLKL